MTDAGRRGDVCRTRALRNREGTGFIQTGLEQALLAQPADVLRAGGRRHLPVSPERGRGRRGAAAAGSGAGDPELAAGATERLWALGEQALGLFGEVFLPGWNSPCHCPLSQPVSPVTGCAQTPRERPRVELGARAEWGGGQTPETEASACLSGACKIVGEYTSTHRPWLRIAK